jgi:hypothetical protein
MRNRFFQFILTVISLFVTSIAFAQDLNNADTSGMRSEGKIYVVMAVCLTILTGLILYLISIDRKIKKIEEHQ